MRIEKGKAHAKEKVPTWTGHHCNACGVFFENEHAWSVKHNTGYSTGNYIICLKCADNAREAESIVERIAKEVQEHIDRDPSA